jgi:glycosyltransferase involved in cell wall biosynthesis
LATARFRGEYAHMARSLIIAHTEASLGWGGQEIRVLAEMRILRQRGHQLWLIAPPSSQIFQRAQAEDFPVYPLDVTRWKYPPTIFSLARWLFRQKVDVLNTHSSRDGWIGGLAGKMASVPLVLRTRHIEVDYPHRGLSRVAFLDLADHVITTSERIRLRLTEELDLPDDHVVCIPTGQDLARFDPSTPGVLHHELQLPPATPLIGMVSVLRSWKGHETFLRTAQELHRLFPQLHFVIAGAGPMQPLIVNWIEEYELSGCVHLLGHRDDVPAVLASLTALVLPSTAHEGIPQIILQAQAMGRPVVGSRVGGLPEVIEHEVNGLLVEPRDPTALAAALTRLLKEPDFAQRLGAQALTSAREHYGVERMADRLEELYLAAG